MSLEPVCSFCRVESSSVNRPFARRAQLVQLPLGYVIGHPWVLTGRPHFFFCFSFCAPFPRLPFVRRTATAPPEALFLFAMSSSFPENEPYASSPRPLPPGQVRPNL